MTLALFDRAPSLQRTVDFMLASLNLLKIVDLVGVSFEMRERASQRHYSRLGLSQRFGMLRHLRPTKGNPSRGEVIPGAGDVVGRVESCSCKVQENAFPLHLLLRA